LDGSSRYGVGMQRPRVKICGVTRLDDALAAVDLGAWAVGMIFYEDSPRQCTLAEAERIGAALRRRAEIVGVFVNSTPAQIAEVSDRVGLTLVQLHGDEGPAFCSEIARRTGARTIKAASVRGPGSLQDLERFHTDFHLLDGYAAGMRGGTGERFDWSLLSRRKSKIPLIVSGGLDAEHVGDAIAATRPYAVDVASGVEESPGIKDHARMKAFFDATAAACASELVV
jgi:phosphoribosylanthranilate isomerase